MKDIKCNKVFFTLCIALPSPVAMMKGHIPEVYTKMFIILCHWVQRVILIVMIGLTILACRGELGILLYFWFQGNKKSQSEPARAAQLLDELEKKDATIREQALMIEKIEV